MRYYPFPCSTPDRLFIALIPFRIFFFCYPQWTSLTWPGIPLYLEFRGTTSRITMRTPCTWVTTDTSMVSGVAILVQF